MPDRPLLLLPRPSIAEREKERPQFVPNNYHLPCFDRQKERLSEQFESMYRAFVSDSTAGIEPEYVLVLETIGKIDGFQQAARAVGMEWLAEIEQEEIEPDEDFYQRPKINKRLFSQEIEGISAKQSTGIWELLKNKGFIDSNGFILDKPIVDIRQIIPEELSEYTDQIISAINDEIMDTKGSVISGRFFLCMSNRQAIDNLLSLWKKWDSENRKLEYNFGKWAEVFKQLKRLRKWDVLDRIKETGVLKYWEEELEIKKGTASLIPFEIELWYRRNAEKRKNVEAKLIELIKSENGNVIKTCIIEEINFHGIKAELPPDKIEGVLNSKFISLFQSNDVMFFRPSGQCVVEIYSEGENQSFHAGSAAGEPIVAILDGYPFANHSLLENRLIIDDPDDFGSSYQANEMKHGTAMASLVCHGELDAGEASLTRPVYIRPIMKPDEDDPRRREHIPDEMFAEDLVERAVKRIFEGETGQPPVASSIKVINLSVCNPAQMYFNQLSSWARLLDWLSSKYKVLFCVSAGNVVSDLVLGLDEEKLKSLPEKELTKLVLTKCYSNMRNRRIISPAEAINALTIGAIHSDKSNVANQGNRLDLLPSSLLPSPISPHGFGFRNSIKPEIYLPGGRQLYTYLQDNVYTIDKSGQAPGHQVATAPVIPGEKGRVVYTRGTSNSAALATRGAALIYEAIEPIIMENHIPQDNIAVLLKALLVHGASWRESRQLIENCLKDESNSKGFKKVISRFIGFGIPDIQRVVECTRQRVTALGYGQIKKDEKHEFILPLPPSLSGSNVLRKLIITLAWFSPVNCDSRRYRKANLSFEPPKEAIGVSRGEADAKQVRNGTVQHEVLEGEEIVSYQDGDYLIIPVVCREDAGNLDEEVYYGLAVTLEVSENVDIPIYEEIRARIREQIRIDERQTV